MRKYYKSDIIKNAKSFEIYQQFCIYFLLYNDEIVYVGYSKRVLSRLSFHVSDKHFNRVFVINQPDEKTALREEAKYIQEFNPVYNRINTSHKNKYMDVIDLFEKANNLEQKSTIKNKKNRFNSNEKIISNNESLNGAQVIEQVRDVEKNNCLIESKLKFNLINGMFIKKEINGIVKYVVKLKDKIYESNADSGLIIHDGKEYDLEGKTFGTFINQRI